MGGPGERSGAGPLFLNPNRNKRRIVLDLEQPAGGKVLLKLCAWPLSTPFPIESTANRGHK
ncbi:MAG TPA: CoA transferase [Steroidobacteraceae bacterium]|jgi:crotonobetainyl-CoA:carnitine CoA-transferase CaiB-like acyl-CoA transferase|nr:CoA transferase [Steroidobacteraceae bacterium]